MQGTQGQKETLATTPQSHGGRASWLVKVAAWPAEKVAGQPSGLT